LVFRVERDWPVVIMLIVVIVLIDRRNRFELEFEVVREIVVMGWLLMLGYASDTER
jgi:hypothetical protein